MKNITHKFENYDVHFIKTNKFKSNILSLVLITEFDKLTLTKNALLRNLITRSNKNLKSEVEVIKKEYELYNSTFKITSEILNNVMVTNFNIEFIDEKYTKSGMNNQIVNYFFDMILNPNVDNGKFESVNFKIAKDNLYSFYDRQKEDKNTYSINKAFELLDEKYLTYNVNGYKEELDKLNESNMYEYYKELFLNSSASVFAIGDFNDDDMTKKITENLDPVLKKNENPYRVNNFLTSKDVKTKIDKEENNQTKLVMLYKMIDINRRERNVILPIFNRIFGVGNNSRLFMNVREEKSLAYDIRSISYPDESIDIVLAGISKKSSDDVINSVKYELEQIQKGNITKESFNNAIMSRGCLIKRFYDSNISILYAFISSILFDSDNLVTREKELETVSIEEVVELSKKLELSIIYLLEGDKENAED